jgi:hypothetical protein
MADLTDNGHGDSVLDVLGRLREERLAETQTFLAVPVYEDRLWLQVRLTSGSTRMVTLIQSGQGDPEQVLREACKFIADATDGIYLAEGGEGAGMEREPVNPRPLDGEAMGFAAPLESIVPRLVPSRPLDQAHTPATRVRALFATDPTIETFAMALGLWMQGATRQASGRFVGESPAGRR